MRRARRARQSGVALIAVLWLLVILGLLSSALLTSTHFDVLATSNERCRLQASYAAQAGVADATEQLDRWLAVAQVAARGGTPAAGLLPAAADASEPGLLLEFDRPLGDGRYRVVAVDVNSRINVNLATEQMLTTLLGEAGRPSNDAEALAQAILDWIDGDDLRRARGAEAAEYRRLGLDHLPRNGPIATLEEVLHVRGMTPEILYGAADDRWAFGRRRSGIAQWLTVQGSGRINLNTAPPEVLAALPGFTPAVVAVVLDLRQRRWIWSISDVAADPRLGGAPSLEAVARQLIRLTAQGLGTEGVWVRSQGAVSGCPVAADVEALLAFGNAGGVVVASWREGLGAGVH